MKSQQISHQRGVTLIELLIVVLIIAVVLGATLPGMEQIRARKHLEGASAQLETELQFARSMAVARNEAVRFTFGTQGAAGCYVIHTGGPNACSCGNGAAPACTGDAEILRSVNYAADAPVNIHSNSRTFAFSQHYGTVTPTATLELTNRRAEKVHLVINIMGRVRSCTPTVGLQGYVSC